MNALFRTSILAGVAIFAARQALFILRDLGRYNAMSAMSGDPPLLSTKTKRAPTNAAALVTNPMVLLSSVPDDITRYLKMRSM